MAGEVAIIVMTRMYWLVLFCMLSYCGAVHATHNRAGEITYEQIDDVTIRATITTYTRTSSFAADRDSLELVWGDGLSSIVQRINNTGQELENDIKVNIYQAIHTYPSRGTYTMYVIDPNRIAGILNIDFPNSVNIQFYLETTFTLLDPRFQGSNSSVILLQPPIDYACPNQPFTYNPNAYDPDGDSIAYELIVPFQDLGIEVPNYVLPDLISPGPENNVFLDGATGDFLWDSPKIQGEFNITYRINEYRNGILINSMVRDMQILVRSCPGGNRAPKIEVREEYCVIAGESVVIDILSTDADSNEVLTLSVLGGPFAVDDSARFDLIGVDTPSIARGRIIWNTNCDLVSEEYYQIVVKSTDIITRPRSALATLKTIRIKVVAPPISITAVEKINDLVEIRWARPYTCDAFDRFQGFSVWRSIGASNLVVDSCQGGLDGTGYEKVVFLTSMSDALGYIANDSGLDRGRIYCYRVVGEFGDRTESGNLFNRTQSLPSDPICIRSSGEEPLLTHVSVLRTDDSDGSISVQWELPDVSLIDTLELVGPYKVALYQSSGFVGDNFEDLAVFESQEVGSLSELRDTNYNVLALNTLVGPYSYRVDLVSGDAVFSSDIASSVFVASTSGDQSIDLEWREEVPWNNYEYLVHQVNADGMLDLIAVGSVPSIDIGGLENGEEYCYVVEARGSYGLKGLEDPLINFSNVVCDTPRDNMAPCSPDYEVVSVCEDGDLRVGNELINNISWNPCLEIDLAGYRVYFRSAGQEGFELVEELDAGETELDHFFVDNIAGCYRVTAFDHGGNESQTAVEICVDNCPTYILPNAFSPNADQSNDLFRARENNFIERVEFEVFNRWGQKVWSTEDPDINWDGTNYANKELAEGTYYYYCRVFERRVTGIEERGDVLQGYIQLLK